MWDVIDLSRWQFALTALYHFLFVPLTLGLIFFAGYHGNHLRGHRQNNLPRYDALLGVSSSVSTLLLAWLPA